MLGTKRSAVLLASVLAVGCSTAPDLAPPIRAVWVTRMSYETERDVREIIADCADAGFDTVLFQVRGNGTVYYRSELEPWSESFGFRDPGYDPLAVALEEARAHGLALHAWINVMPAWRGPGEPAHSGQLYHQHPDWFWYDAEGRRQPWHHAVGDSERDWYVSLNPCLPEVRAYLVAIVRELASCYEVDGVHLDYIRFPNEPVVPGEEIPDYPRDGRTRARFAEATGGLAPDDDPAAWNRWRTEQVTELVRGISEALRETRPRAALSAAVGSRREHALRRFQDAHTWIDEGLLDFVLPMAYAPDMARFEARIEEWHVRARSFPVVPGVMMRGDVPIVREQIARARDVTGNFCAFSYTSTFGPRREQLEPLIREAAAADDDR